MARSHSFFGALALAGAGVVCGWLTAPLGTPSVHGQAARPASAAESRARLYASLEQEVAELERQGNVLKTVVKIVSPTVVHIDARKTEAVSGRRYGERTVEEAGSGVIIDLAGRTCVITNRHVIKDARPRDIEINLADGRSLRPRRVWADPQTDVALMEIVADGLAAARVGDSDRVEIGDFVLAVGSPFGLSRSVTFGIVSAKSRRDLELGDEAVRYQDFLQTDAAINPGNSGGPLINLRGEVVGINTAIASNSGGSEGIGFSIPINMVLTIAEQFVERGAVARAWLGVHLDRGFGFDEARGLGLAGQQGARITKVTEGSPAALADLRVGDVVLTFDGVPVEDDAHLVNLVGVSRVDRDVPVRILREGNTIPLNVRIGTSGEVATEAADDQPIE